MVRQRYLESGGNGGGGTLSGATSRPSRRTGTMHRTLEGQRQEYRDDEWIVWSGENKESTYIAIFNVSDEKKEIPGKLTERYLRKDAKEIWSGKKVTEGTEEVESHGCVLYQMKRI